MRHKQARRKLNQSISALAMDMKTFNTSDLHTLRAVINEKEKPNPDDQQKLKMINTALFQSGEITQEELYK